MHAHTALLVATAISSIYAFPFGKERRQVCFHWKAPLACVKARSLPSLLEGATNTAVDATNDAVDLVKGASKDKRQLLGAVGDVLDAGNDVVDAAVKAEDSVDGVTGNEKRNAEPQACTPLSPPGCLKNSKRQLGDALGDVVDAADGAVDTAEGAVQKREAEAEAAVDNVVMLKRQICLPLVSPPGCVKARDLSAEERDQVSKMKRSADAAPVVVLKRQICLPLVSPPGCVKARDLTDVERRQWCPPTRPQPCL